MSFRIPGIFSSRLRASPAMARDGDESWLSRLRNRGWSLNLGITVLTRITIVLLVVIAIALWQSFTVVQSRTTYVAVIGEIRTLSERMQSTALRASEGESKAFPSLVQTRDRLRLLVDTVVQGGDLAAGHISTPPEQLKAQLDRLAAEFDRHSDNVSIFVAQSASIVALADANKSLGENSALIRYFADDVAQQKAGPSSLPLVLTLQKLLAASAAFSARSPDEQIVAVLKSDAERAKSLLASFDPSHISDDEVRQRFDLITARVDSIAGTVLSSLSKPREIIDAKRAADALGRDSGELVSLAGELENAFSAYILGRLSFPMIIIGLSLFTVFFVVLELMSIARNNSAAEIQQRKAALPTQRDHHAPRASGQQIGGPRLGLSGFGLG